MSLVAYARTEGSLGRSPFACEVIGRIVFSYCNVWDLGRLCQTNGTLYSEIMSYFRKNKCAVFRNDYTDVRVDVSIYNKMQVYFSRLYQMQDHQTLRDAIDFLERHRIYHDCKQWYYIVDDWNTYTGYGAYPHTKYYSMMVYEESSSEEEWEDVEEEEEEERGWYY